MEQPPETYRGCGKVLSKDENRTDLVDSQYFLFNLLALGFFFVVFIGGLKDGLPDISEVLSG